MSRWMFWDVDTQHDFMMGDGNLYVPEAMGLVSQLQKLTNYARETEIPIWGSVDYHSETDSELSGTPDFRDTYPPHCLQGTPGQEKIPVTRPRHPLWIDSRPYPNSQLEQLIRSQQGEIFFRKQKFDVFSNPNVEPALEIAAPENLLIYGVALDVCVCFAIEGFLKLGKFKIALVQDATRPIRKERGQELLQDWRRRGMRTITTDAVVDEGALDKLS